MWKEFSFFFLIFRRSGVFKIGNGKGQMNSKRVKSLAIDLTSFIERAILSERACGLRERGQHSYESKSP